MQIPKYTHFNAQIVTPPLKAQMAQSLQSCSLNLNKKPSGGGISQHSIFQNHLQSISGRSNEGDCFMRHAHSSLGGHKQETGVHTLRRDKSGVAGPEAIEGIHMIELTKLGDEATSNRKNPKPVPKGRKSSRKAQPANEPVVLPEQSLNSTYQRSDPIRERVVSRDNLD